LFQKIVLKNISQPRRAWSDPPAGGEAVGARVKKILPLEQNYSVSEKNFLKQILRFRLGFRKRFLPC